MKMLNKETDQNYNKWSAYQKKKISRPLKMTCLLLLKLTVVFYHYVLFQLMIAEISLFW